MKTFLTFDDVLIAPQFSSIESRKDVDLSTKIGNHTLKLPVFSANMDSVTGPEMAIAMAQCGGMGVLHRFNGYMQNVEDFVQVSRHAGQPVAVSFGLGEEELARAHQLYANGARLFFLDVAHGAQVAVALQYHALKHAYADDITIVVGNFATSESIREFIRILGYEPDTIKVGIGPGSACTTRVKTGIGVPQFDAVRMCAKNYNGVDIPIIADGGLCTAGDIAKALAAGASAVMIGGMLSGTDETPGIILDGNVKKYRGSASKSSYDDQGKSSGWRTAEGAEFYVPCKGSTEHVLKDIEGGLRSAFTYTGARNLEEFQQKAQFIEVTNAGKQESVAHGDKNGTR